MDKPDFLKMIMQQIEKNILIVDDEHRSADSLAIGLKKAGYLTQTAYNGKEGLIKLNKARFDFILCDINMPEMDGWKFADQALLLDSDLDLIFITAGPRAVIKKEYGSYPILIKPIELKNLLKLLAQRGGVNSNY